MFGWRACRVHLSSVHFSLVAERVKFGSEHVCRRQVLKILG
jgi:hypothetical protein